MPEIPEVIRLMTHKAEDVESVASNTTPTKDPQPRYAETDVQMLYGHGQGKWHAWSNLINWVERNGDKDTEIAAGAASALKEDLTKLQKDSVPFTDDPRKAYRLMQKHTAHGKQPKG